MSGLRTVAFPSLMLIACLALAQLCHAQQQQRSMLDSVRRSEKLLGYSITSPRKAAILAAVVPGAGQVYNRQLWKLPLVYGALGGATYLEVRYWQRYREYRQGYEARKRFANGDRTAIDLGKRSSQEPTDAAQQARFYAYRTSRDLWLGITAGIYGLQILDAITAAHLREFDINEDLALCVRPALLSAVAMPVAPGIQLDFVLRPASRTIQLQKLQP